MDGGFSGDGDIGLRVVIVVGTCLLGVLRVVFRGKYRRITRYAKFSWLRGVCSGTVVILDAFWGGVPREPTVRGMALDLRYLGNLSCRTELDHSESCLELFGRRYHKVRR